MSLEQIASQSRASQNKQELLKLLEFVSQIEPEVILEIGVHKGYSLETWNQAFDPKLMIGVDIDVSQLDKEAIKDIDEVHIIDGCSNDIEVFEMVKDGLKGRTVDFLFLDGDHIEKIVRRDFELYSQLVRPGGIVAFHDAALKTHPMVEVYKVFEELAQNHPNKLFIGFDGSQEDKLQAQGTGTGVICL